MTASERRVFQLIAVLALAGIVVSSVSLQHHYGTSQTNYCDFGASFNCDIVNRSVYRPFSECRTRLSGFSGTVFCWSSPLFTDKNRKLRCAFGCFHGGAWLRSLSHLHREVRAGDVVYFVSVVAVVDYSDYGVLLFSGGEVYASELSRSSDRSILVAPARAGRPRLHVMEEVSQEQSVPQNNIRHG